jgi:hypothetical protein
MHLSPNWGKKGKISHAKMHFGQHIQLIYIFVKIHYCKLRLTVAMPLPDDNHRFVFNHEKPCEFSECSKKQDKRRAFKICNGTEKNYNIIFLAGYSV